MMIISYLKDFFFSFFFFFFAYIIFLLHVISLLAPSVAYERRFRVYSEISDTLEKSLKIIFRINIKFIFLSHFERIVHAILKQQLPQNMNINVKWTHIVTQNRLTCLSNISVIFSFFDSYGLISLGIFGNQFRHRLT